MNVNFSLCGIDDLKEDTKNMDRLEDYLISVALGHEDPKDWFIEALRQFRDMKMIAETLIIDAERTAETDKKQ